MQFIIGGLKKTSLLDYPHKISAIVFTQGCNFRCGYCHNPGLLKGSKSDSISLESFFEFLSKRQGKLDGVVITGGEPTLQKDLICFIEQIKKMGFLVKLDTNGSNPDVIRKLLADGLIDYIAMDIKAPLDKYHLITNVQLDVEKISQSISLIMGSVIDYEFRTTVISSQLSFNDFNEIGKIISGAKRYFLQKFEVKTEILDNSLSFEKSYSDEEFNLIINLLKKYIDVVGLR